MLARLALAAALLHAPPAPEGPQPPSVSPTSASPPPARGPTPSTSTTSANPATAAGPMGPLNAPEGPAPAPASPKPPAEPAAGPGAVPKIPSPRALTSEGTGPIKPVSEDTLGALGMKRLRDGTMMYVDAGKRFTAVFNADGTVRFGDRWNRDQHGQRMPGSRGALRQINMAGLGMSGPSEWLIKLQDLLGGPEEHASAKREFLNRTREVRTQMTIAWTLKLLTYRLGTLERELFDLWNAAGEPAAKRELIFQRWDECDEAYRVEIAGEVTEEAASEIDRARTQTAEEARRIIESFVRRQLPRPGPNAYSPRELGDMNGRRTSRQEFRPYDLQANKRTAP